MMILGTILAISVLQNHAPASPTPSVDLAERKSRWRESLRRSFKGFSESVAIDVNMDSQVPSFEVPPRSAGAKVADQCATLLNRLARDAGGGWAFVREATSSLSPYNNYLAITNWLDRCSDQELARLCGDGVAYEDLPRSTQQVFERLCRNAGLQRRMVAGEFVRCSLRFQFVATVVNRSGTSVTTLLDVFARDSDKEKDLDRLLEKSTLNQRPDVVVPRLTKGTLDFSSGELLTLAELCARAGSKLGVAYQYDGRLENSTYYIQGKYTPEQFTELLTVLTTPIPTRGLPEISELKRKLDEALRTRLLKYFDPASSPEGLSYGDALSGRQLNAGGMSKYIENLGQFLTTRNVDPASKFTLSAGLNFNLTAPGAYADPSRPTESPVANRFGITFRTVP